MTKTALSFHDNDDVAIVVTQLVGGDIVTVRRERGAEYTLDVCEVVEFGHKIALHDIPRGAPVHKYGEVIGVASVDIGVGEHVHVHNID